MRMQEQEQEEWQGDQQYGAYRVEDPSRYESEQQKIYPQEEQKLKGTVLVRVVIALSWFGIFLAIPGIVASASVLKYASGQQTLLATGVMGLVSSILVLTMFLAIFVLSVIAVARRGACKK